MLKIESKYRYFSVQLTSIVGFETRPESDREYLLEMVDMIFLEMNVDDEWFSFISNDKYHYIYLFKCESRNQLKQLRKLCKKYLPSADEFIITGYNKVNFQAKLKQLKNSPEEWIPIKLVTHYKEFSKSKLELNKFDNQEYWFPWQKDIYYKIFDENDNIIKADQRKIISIIDEKGKKGKSEFLKWICYNHPKNCIKLSQGSTSQLRAAVVNYGPKQCYFIDLRRTEEDDDKLVNLMSVIKEIKNGHVMSTMYGLDQSLIMPYPHIIIFSNRALNYNLLSKDQWEVYEMTGDFKFKPIDVSIINFTSATSGLNKKVKAIINTIEFLKEKQIVIALLIKFLLAFFRSQYK